MKFKLNELVMWRDAYVNFVLSYEENCYRFVCSNIRLTNIMYDKHTAETMCYFLTDIFV